MTDQFATVEASGGEGQANLNLWLRDATPWVPGAHRSVMKRQLILACREFFEQSLAWRASVGPINIVSGQNTYQLSPFNAYTDVVRVLGAEINAVPINPLQRRPSNDGTQTPVVPFTDFPTNFYLLRPDIVALYPTPDKDLPQSLQIYVALKPKTSVKQLPHLAVTHFYEAILNGFLYRMLNQPAKTYSNPALAMYFEKKFRAQIAEYAGIAKKGFNNAGSWQFPRFGK